jgi:hypothetical protein
MRGKVPIEPKTVGRTKIDREDQRCGPIQLSKRERLNRRQEDGRETGRRR